MGVKLSADTNVKVTRARWKLRLRLVLHQYPALNEIRDIEDMLEKTFKQEPPKDFVLNYFVSMIAEEDVRTYYKEVV